MTTNLPAEQHLSLLPTCPRLLRYKERETGISTRVPDGQMSFSPRPSPWQIPPAAAPSGPAASTACTAATGRNIPNRRCKPARWRRHGGVAIRRLLRGNTEIHCIHRQLGGRGFLSPRMKISLKYWKNSPVQGRKLSCCSGGL